MANLNALSAMERETYSRAKNHFESGEIEPALNGFTDLLESHDDFADVHYMVGLLFERRGELDAATESLGKAIELNPRYAEALLALSSIHERQGDFERSRNLSERATEASQVAGKDLDFVTTAKLANLQASVGDAYAEVGERREAIEAYRKALDRCPNFHDIRYRLGIVLREAGLPHQASIEFKRALRGNAEFTDARVQLGLTYFSLGRPADAATQWDQAAGADPDRSDIRLYRRLVADLRDRSSDHSLEQGTEPPIPSDRGTD